MPRVTRSALASPARSSPRETTKASSTSSKSVSSPALKTRHGAKEGTSAEDTEEKVTRRQAKEKGTGDAGTKRRSGRRSSEPAEEVEPKTRGRGTKAAEKKQKDEEEESASRSRSRGRGGKQAKKDEEEEKEVETTSRRKRGGKQQTTEEAEVGEEKVEKASPAPRGRTKKSGGRGKQQEEPQEEEAEAEEATVKESEETPTRRGRGKLPAPDKTSTPSPATSRGRSRKEKQEDTEAMEVDEEDKPKEEVTPRRRGRKAEATESKTPDVTPSSRARRTRTPKESPDVSSGRRGRSTKTVLPEKKKESEVAADDFVDPMTSKPEVAADDVMDPLASKPEVAADDVLDPVVSRPEVAADDVVDPMVSKPEVAADDFMDPMVSEELEAPSLKDERTERKSESATDGADPPSIEQEAPSIHLDNILEPPAKKQGMSEMPDIEPEPMATEQDVSGKTEEPTPKPVVEAKPDVVVHKVLDKKSEQVSVADRKKSDVCPVVKDRTPEQKPVTAPVVSEQSKPAVQAPVIQAPIVEDISAEEEEESQDVPELQQKSQAPEAVEDAANGIPTKQLKPVTKQSDAAPPVDQNKSKRKFEPDVVEEDTVSSKRARVNGDEVELKMAVMTNTVADRPHVESAEAACADVEMSEGRAWNQITQAVQEPSQSDAKAAQPVMKTTVGVSSGNEASAKATKPSKTEDEELDYLKEYVIISESDIPPPDSKEVANATPKIPKSSSVEPASTSTDPKEAAASSKSTSSSVEEMVTSTQAVSSPGRGLTSASVGSSSAEAQQLSSGASEVSQQISQVSSQAVELGSTTSSLVSESSAAEAMEVDTPDTSAQLETSVGKPKPREPVSTTGAISVTNNMYSAKPLARVNAVDHTQNTNTVFPTAGTSYDIFHRTFLPNPSIPLSSTDVSHRFSIVSYNILADFNMRKIANTYDYTEPQFLEQDYRHKLLIDELKYLDSDIVCMQEVNPDYFKNLLEPAMNSLGYQGGMMKRTLDSFNEGEATFFKINRFSLVDSQGVSLTELAYKEIEEAGLTDDVKAAAQKYLNKADVVYISQLRCNFTHKMVTIGNVHIVWDEHKHPDVQCIQIACAIKEVVNRAGSNDSSHIICGDFNLGSSTPGYQLACDGYLSDASLATLQAIENLDIAGVSKSLVNHVWRAFQHTSSTLKSAYSTVQKHEPRLTTFTKFYHDAVDYVFHNSSLETLGVLETVNAEVIDATGGLPSKSFPSDHVSLKAELSFKD
ncbi:muscle M-line assembly protein unc-89-like [Gigantopelta aegis]|uniref:muscle M-line assembly protein unc-89-like n=1 Tax=Gigantopelta aegis TaxID=1735272 RepID=UPI001B887D45|nr:muscle M-line assembly protein unc-89-like [Gigantopelta aegis]